MSRIAIVGATVLDTVNSKPDPRKKTLLIEDNVIKAWLEPHEPTTDAKVIDASELWVVPGLIDLHFHPYLIDMDPSVPREHHTLAREVHTALNTLKVWLESGVTTVRSAGAHENLDVDLRDLIKGGVVQGPRMFAAGYLIAMTSGLRAGNEKIATEVTGPDEARAVARRQIKAGVDQLKLYTSSSVGGGGGRLMGPPGWPQLDEDEIRAVVEEAEHAGLPTMAHATSPQAVMNCLRAGVHCIEHASRLDETSIRALAEKDVPIVPTLAIGWSLATFGVERGFGEHIARSAAQRQKTGMASVLTSKRAGVRIGAGTDADNSKALLREECRLLVEAGLTPYEALRSATVEAAQILRQSRYLGSLQPGASADAVLLSNSPLDDIHHLSGVQGVMKQGEMIVWRKSEQAPALA